MIGGPETKADLVFGPTPTTGNGAEGMNVPRKTMPSKHFTVEIRDYESGGKEIDTADIEEAVQSVMDERGDDGIIIVSED